MRYYFAGAYERRAELAHNVTLLQAAVPGSYVVSRWLHLDQASEDAGFSAGGLKTPGSAARAWSYAQRDLEDLSICQAIVSFTGEGVRGGRHVEHGYAMTYLTGNIWFRPGADPFRLIVVGPREHIFHCHPATEVYADFEAFLEHEAGSGRQAS